MDRTKTLGVVVALLGAALSCGGHRGIRVGSKNFTEQVILGEIIAQHVENRLHQPVDRRLNLGGTLLAHQALTNGEIDLYPEYTGTAVAAILKQPEVATSGDVLARIRSEYERRFQVQWLDPLGIDNSFAMVIRGPYARRMAVNSLSDAARVPAGWVLGAGYEFEQRADGLPALEKTYHIKWSAPAKSMDLGLLYRALEQQQVSMIAANGTDGLLSRMDVKVLADDLHAFPSYQVCVAARRESLDRIAGLRNALAELSGRFTNTQMQQLNYQVDVEHRPVAEVAREFLKRMR